MDEYILTKHATIMMHSCTTSKISSIDSIPQPEYPVHTFEERVDNPYQTSEEYFAHNPLTRSLLEQVISNRFSA